MWNVPYRFTSLNTWSPAVALFGKDVEPTGSGTLLKEVSHREVRLEAYRLAWLPVLFLLPNHPFSGTSWPPSIADMLSLPKVTPSPPKWTMSPKTGSRNKHILP